VKEKTMKPTRSLILFIAIATLSYTSQKLISLSSDELKARQITGIDLKDVSTINAVTSALNAAHVPGGVVTISTCGGERSHNLTPLGPTLRDALDSIVIADPQYRWYIDQGVVNFVPANDEPTLLNGVIANFKVESDKTLDLIVGELLALPEVKEAATGLNLSQGFTEIGISSLERPGYSKKEEKKGCDFDLQTISVREALNAIARARGKAVWSYQEKRCNGVKEFSIRFLVQ
jgi:hypothetical protein